MTDMLQKTENVAKNVANENSQDLTEQWKKGKIPEAWYYVKDIHNKEILDRYFKETDNFEYLEDWEVNEVLAPVPSYEEHLESEAHCVVMRELYDAEKEKNAQLKELLKECKEIFDECFSPSAKHGELYKQIDEALR